MLHLASFALRASRLNASLPPFVLLPLALVCAGAAKADIWQSEDEITYPQGLWGNQTTNPGAALVLANFGTVYGSEGDLLVLGLPGTGFAVTFDSSFSVIQYLPDAGLHAELTR